MTTFQSLTSVDVDELEEGETLVLPPREENVTLRKDIRFEDRYTPLDELGRGGYGVVKKCQDKKSGEIYAAKYVQKTARSMKEIAQEVSVMNNLHHKRIVYLVDAFESPKHLVVVMELITGGELFEKVVEEDDLTEKQVVRYMRQVLFGLQHMHRKNIAHLDLKPENILCVGGGKCGYEELKLIDFGLSKQLDPNKPTTVFGGTPEFVSPEVALVEPVTLAADMWSIGVICYVLISGISPFQDEDNSDDKTMQNVTNCNWNFEDGEECFDQVSDEAKLFIEELLVRAPEERNTVDDCLNHPWFVRVSNEKKLKTQRLKKFLVRRRWQKAANALRAVCRLDMLGQVYAKNHGRTAKGNLKPLNKLFNKASESLKPSDDKRSGDQALRLDSAANGVPTPNVACKDQINDSSKLASSSDKQSSCAKAEEVIAKGGKMQVNEEAPCQKEGASDTELCSKGMSSLEKPFTSSTNESEGTISDVKRASLAIEDNEHSSEKDSSEEANSTKESSNEKALLKGEKDAESKEEIPNQVGIIEESSAKRDLQSGQQEINSESCKSMPEVSASNINEKLEEGQLKTIVEHVDNLEGSTENVIDQAKLILTKSITKQGVNSSSIDASCTGNDVPHLTEITATGSDKQVNDKESTTDSIQNSSETVQNEVSTSALEKGENVNKTKECDQPRLSKESEKGAEVGKNNETEVLKPASSTYASQSTVQSAENSGSRCSEVKTLSGVNSLSGHRLPEQYMVEKTKNDVQKTEKLIAETSSAENTPASVAKNLSEQSVSKPGTGTLVVGGAGVMMLGQNTVIFTQPTSGGSTIASSKTENGS